MGWGSRKSLSGAMSNNSSLSSLFSEESIFSNLKSRLRSIGISPSGEIYLLTDGRKGKLLKVTITEK